MQHIARRETDTQKNKIFFFLFKKKTTILHIFGEHTARISRITSLYQINLELLHHSRARQAHHTYIRQV